MIGSKKSISFFSFSFFSLFPLFFLSLSLLLCLLLCLSPDVTDPHSLATGRWLS